MAVILVLAGSLLGFLAGITSFIAFDASIFQALGIWMVAGLIATVVGLLAGLFAGQSTRSGEDQQFEVA